MGPCHEMWQRPFCSLALVRSHRVRFILSNAIQSKFMLVCQEWHASHKLKIVQLVWFLLKHSSQCLWLASFASSENDVSSVNATEWHYSGDVIYFLAYPAWMHLQAISPAVWSHSSMLVLFSHGCSCWGTSVLLTNFLISFFIVTQCKSGLLIPATWLRKGGTLNSPWVHHLPASGVSRHDRIVWFGLNIKGYGLSYTSRSF